MVEKDNGQQPMTMDDIMAQLEDMSDVQIAYDSMPMQQKLGVLQRLVTAVKDRNDYMQIFLTAAFDDKSESNAAADAWAERIRYGVDTTPLLLRIVAQCGIKSKRVDQILHALTNYTLNTNNPFRRQSASVENKQL